MTTAHAGGLDERWNAVLEHRDRAVRVARARLSDPHDVDDCVQEGMARVVAMPSLDLRRVGPLLSTVVANVAADTHRQHVRSRRLVAKVTSTVVPTQADDEPVCDAAEARWLYAQLDVLGARERAVVELRAQGRTVAQTAAALGMTYKATESAFTRGRNALKGVWRTSLIGLAVLLRRTWRSQQPVVTAAVLAAATLGVVVLGLGQPVAPAPQHAATPGQGSAVLPLGTDGLRVHDAVTAPRRAGAVGHPSTRRISSSTRLATVDAPPRVGLVDPGRTWVQRERQDESLAETLERCVRRGVTITPREISCRD